MFGLKLRTQITIVMVLVVTVVIFANNVVLSVDFTKRYTVALQSEARVHADGLAREIAKTLALGVSIDAVKGLEIKCSEIVNEYSNIGYAIVTGKEGKILYHNNGSETGKKREADWLGEVKKGSSKKHVVQKTSYLDKEFYDISVPVADASGQVAGYISIGLKSAMISDALRGAGLLALTVAVLFVFVAALIAFVLGKTLVIPINRVVDMLKDIAMGEGDLTKRLNIESKDEIGELGHWFDIFMENTQKMMRKFKDTTSHIYEATMAISANSSAVSEGAEAQLAATMNASSSIDEMTTSFGDTSTNIDELSSTTEEASSSILEMAASIDEVANIAEEVSSSVDDASSSVEEMFITIKEVAGISEELSLSADSTVASISEISASIKEVERAAKDTVGVAQETSSDAEQGMMAVEKTIEGMNKIRLSVNEASEVIKKLGERSNDIGEILNVIDEVAEQTNLLALNAAIIAAQAGEHGKGFAVVSDEIMDLSERTAASTKEISTLIKSLQKESDNAVRSMDMGLKRVEEGADLSQEAGASLEKILNGAMKSKDMVGHIASATVEQLKGIDQVKGSMENVNNIVMRIVQATQEQSRGSELIVKATEMMKDATGHVKRATQEQSKGGKQITTAIEKITNMTNFVNSATQEQAGGVKHVVGDIEEIKKLAGAYGVAVKGMFEAVESLIAQTEILGEEIQNFKV